MQSKLHSLQSDFSHAAMVVARKRHQHTDELPMDVSQIRHTNLLKSGIF